MKKLNAFSNGIMKFTFICAVMMIGISIFRLSTIFSVPPNYSIYPTAPLWVIGFIKCLFFSLIVIAFLFGLSGILLLNMNDKAKVLYLVSNSLFIVWCIAYAYLRIVVNKAFYIGGIIWGFIQTITISFYYCESGWTNAGVIGYKTGQILGIVTLFLLPLLYLRLINDSRFQGAEKISK